MIDDRSLEDIFYQAVECLPSKHKALTSNPNATKKINYRTCSVPNLHNQLVSRYKICRDQNEIEDFIKML
jgi:hypothetical protein